VPVRSLGSTWSRKFCGQVERPNPSINLAIVRRGLDYGRQGFDRWDLTREVLKAVRPVSSAGLQ
jgi:hypothetical protein